MDASPRDLLRALHAFGLARDGLRSALARRLNLAAADLDALEHLEAAGPMPQRDLAERLALTSGAVTQLIDRLERAGMVSREAHPHDRRVTLVRLAPDAELPAVPEMDDYHQKLAHAAANLNTPERAALTAILVELTDAARDAGRRLRR
jgi:DNA-binding MarR family transcriptional regulator